MWHRIRRAIDAADHEGSVRFTRNTYGGPIIVITDLESGKREVVDIAKLAVCGGVAFICLGIAGWMEAGFEGLFYYIISAIAIFVFMIWSGVILSRKKP